MDGGQQLTGYQVDLTGPSQLWREPELSAWRRAAVRALADVDPSLCAPRAGDPILRRELSRLLNLPPGEVVVTAGIRATAAVLMAGCQEVIFERPTFLGVPHILAASGLLVSSRPWEHLAGAGLPETGLWITSPARNPDGRTADQPLLTELATAARAGARVVCNTAYRWYTDDLTLPGEIIQVGTLHKLAGRGANLGWVAGAELGPDALQKLWLSAPPIHWQRTWAYFLAADGAELLLNRHRELGTIRSAFLNTLGGRPSGAGPNILLPVRLPEPEAITLLAARGFLVSPGNAFNADSPAIRTCLTGVTQEQAVSAAAAVKDLISTP